jgi:hypothetical protein
MWYKSGPIDGGGWRPEEDIGLPLLKGATLPEGLPRPYVVVPKPLKEWELAKGNIRAVLKGIDAGPAVMEKWAETLAEYDERHEASVLHENSQTETSEKVTFDPVSLYY